MKKACKKLANNISKMTLLGLGLILCSSAFADDASGGIGQIADNIIGSFGSIAKLITAAAFIAGLGFALASIFKFKAHKDNPTQIPVGTPIAMLFIAIALLGLTYFFQQLGVTVFGSSSVFGTISGTISL